MALNTIYDILKAAFPSTGTNAFFGLAPTDYDYVSLGYTGANITTVEYKKGGSGGTTVATLTLTYSGSNITSITRS